MPNAEAPVVNVLFTSAGRRVELLRAFKRAYGRLQLLGHIVAIDADPLAPALQTANRAYVVPLLTDPCYVATLTRICRDEQIDLVFPLIDPDVPVLARNAEVIEATGATVATIPIESVACVSDKWRTRELFARLGLPVPRSWLPSCIDGDALSFPLFIKPRCGSASKQAFRVRDRAELQFFIRYVEDPIIQEELEGPEITTDVVCAADGGVLAVVSRRRLEVRSGEVAKGVTCYDASITDACVKIAAALKARGPITVQGMLHHGSIHFTEINARFGGGLPLGIAAGADSPRWLLATAAGIPTDIPPLGTYETDLYLTRFDESFWLSRTADGALQGRHF